VTGLAKIAEGLGHRGAPLLAVLLTDPASELAAAVREAKVDSVREANRERLRRVIGPVPDLPTRADTGPALILLHLMLNGTPPDEKHLRDEIVPLMTGPRP
jgi:hypothetical protein